MVEYALKLLSHRLICVPLSNGGRHLDVEAMGYVPLHLQTFRKNLKELSFSSIAFNFSQHPPSPDTLAKWFEGFSGNIGILGGYSNLMILDFDREDLYEKWCRGNLDISSSTPTVKSPNGFHVYLRSENPEVTSSLHYGLSRAGHVKALGGYVLCPPSKASNGATYHWLPGQSPFETEVRAVKGLASLSLRPVCLLKDLHDRIFKRGGFEVT